MGKKKKKKSKQGATPRHTPLARMKKEGSKLRAPLSQLNMTPISWDRDLLPEHLWIAALAEDFGLSIFHEHYSEFLDAFDSVWPTGNNNVCLGLLSDFGTIEVEGRAHFLELHYDLARRLFWKPVGEALLLYPDGPAYWLVSSLRSDKDAPFDLDRALGRLRLLVSKMIGGREEFATRVRVVPFTRPLKHGKMFFMRGMPTVDLLPRYPTDLNESEKATVESFVRASMMSLFAMREGLERWEWSKYFWRKNYDLAVCKPIERALPEGMIAADAPDLERLIQRMEDAGKRARANLLVLTSNVRIDLYEPNRDEILFGLFARMTRLLILMMEQPYLWARDVGSILLRCLADTAITFVYLARKAKPEEFQRFIEYGEGQQKLLMLHLQDNYPTHRSAEGRTIDDLERGLGVLPEFIDIELGHWAGKDARRMARDAGMEEYYRLVFSPTSSDVHGSWMALKNSHLTYCEEPLHRYHRLPDISEPPFFVGIVDAARRLYEECRVAAEDSLGYPPLDPMVELVDDRSAS